MIALPEHVDRYLRCARRRTNRLRRGRALALVGSIALAVLALAMAVDAVATIFDERVRWALSFAVYLTVAGAVLAAFVHLIRKRVTFPQLAREVDAAHPELQERLATLVDVVTREQSGEATGASDALLALLARETDERLAACNCRRDFPLGRLVLWFLPLFLLVGLFAFAHALKPDLTQCLARRVLMPWEDAGNLYADQLDVCPGDLTVLAGSNIVISAQAKIDFGPCRTIRISRKTRAGWDRERATPMDAKGTFETVADLAEPVWRYRVNFGPAVSRAYEVHVVAHPRYETFAARIDWPAYTGRVPSIVTNADIACVRAVVGSRVTFAVRAPAGVTPQLALAGAAASRPATNAWQWTVSCAASNSVPWTLLMANEAGFREKAGEGRLETTVDRAPSVAVQEPVGSELVLPPQGRVPLVFAASDDFGIAAAEWRVMVQGREEPLAAGALAPREGGNAQWMKTLDLSELDFEGINEFVIEAVVHDTCPPAYGGVHAATSTPIRVRLDRNAKDYARQTLDAAMKEAAEDLEKARQNIEQAVKGANELRGEVRKEHGAFNEQAERKLDEVTKLFDEAKEKVEKLARDFKADGRFEPIAEAMRELAENEMAAAAEKVEQAQANTENAAERAQAAQQLPDGLVKTWDRMWPLEEKLRKRAGEVRSLERIQALAERQERLADEAEERTAHQNQAQPDARAEQHAWRRTQEALANQTTGASWNEDSPKLAEAARQMHAAARRARDEARETPRDDAKDRARARAEGLKKLQEAEKNLAIAQAQRNEAAKVEAAHAQREAEEAKAQQQQAGGEKSGDEPKGGQEQDGQQKAARLPYSESERNALRRLNKAAREAERKAAQNEREAADALMRAEAQEATRKAMAEAIDALHQERGESAEANDAFSKAYWNKRSPAPEGRNEQLSKALGAAQEKAKAAERALAEEQTRAEKAKPDDGGSPADRKERESSTPGTSAQAARAAANELQQAAREQCAKMGLPQNGEEQRGEEGMANERMAGQHHLRAARLRALRANEPVPTQLKGILSPEEWIRIRAVLGDAEAVDLTRVPEEYRELVKRYFHILAGEGEKK